MGGFGSATSHGIGFFSSSFICFPPFQQYLSPKNLLYTYFTFSLFRDKLIILPARIGGLFMSQIIRNITEIARCGAQYRTDTLAPMGLKSCHASYLIEICANPGISQDGLAARICINKSNVARQAAILEEDGFVIRTPSTQDKRIMQLYPTQKTLDLLPFISPILSRWEACLTADISDEERAVLDRVLERMKEIADSLPEELRLHYARYMAASAEKLRAMLQG